MIEVIKKAWEETFYPQISAQNRRLNFFDGIENPSFLYYFLEYPLPNSSLAYKAIYFLSLGFILYPLKNLVKATIEFPLILISLTLEKLRRNLSFPGIDLLLAISSSFFSCLRYLVGIVLSPTFWQYRVQSIASNSSPAFLYFLSSVIAALFLRNTVMPLVMSELRRRLPSFAPIGWSLLRGFYIFHSALSSIRAHTLRTEEKEHSRYLAFADFDPNKTLCSISGKSLGFKEGESGSVDATVMRYVEDGQVKYALLTELLSAEQRAHRMSLPIKDLIVGLQEKDPSKNYTQVPSRLTCKFDESLECLILFVPLTPDQHPVRSIYGHYYSSQGIQTWLETQKTCPVSRSRLNPEDLKEIVFDENKAELEKNKAEFDENKAKVVSETPLLNEDVQNPSNRGREPSPFNIASVLEREPVRNYRNCFFREQLDLSREDLHSNCSSRP